MESAVTGVMFQYYHVCKRELWFFARGILPDQADENLALGRFIHKNFYERRAKEFELPGIKIDVIKRSKGVLVVFEISKSTKLLEPKKWQLLYYLYKLKENGAKIKFGYIVVPKEKRRVPLVLTPEIEEYIMEKLEDIRKIISSDVPPPPVEKPYCKGCAYRDLCWV